jgi:hypothetical protein
LAACFAWFYFAGLMPASARQHKPKPLPPERIGVAFGSTKAVYAGLEVEAVIGVVIFDPYPDICRNIHLLAYFQVKHAIFFAM